MLDYIRERLDLNCQILMWVMYSTWRYLGHIEEEDAELITETIKSSPFESEARLAQFGLV